MTAEASTQALIERRARLLGPNVSTFYDDPVHIGGGGTARSAGLRQGAGCGGGGGGGGGGGRPGLPGCAPRYSWPRCWTPAGWRQHEAEIAETTSSSLSNPPSPTLRGGQARGVTCAAN